MPMGKGGARRLGRRLVRATLRRAGRAGGLIRSWREGCTIHRLREYERATAGPST